MLQRSSRHPSRLVKWILTLLAMLIPATMLQGQDFEAVHKRFKRMVKKGELNQEQADAMLATLERMVEGEPRARDEQAMEDRRRIEFEEMQQRKRAEFDEIAAKLRRAVKNGDMSEQDAKRKLAAVERELFDWRRDRDDDNSPTYKEVEDKLKAIGQEIRAAVAAKKMTEEEGREKMDGWRERLMEGLRRSARDRGEDENREHRSERDDDARHRGDRDHELDGDRERNREDEDDQQAEVESAEMQLFKMEAAYQRLKKVMPEFREGRIEAQVRLKRFNQKRDELEKQRTKLGSDLAKLKEMLEEAESTGSINQNGREITTDQLKSIAEGYMSRMETVVRTLKDNSSLAEVWEKNLAILQRNDKVTQDKLKEYEARISEFRSKQSVEQATKEAEAVREQFEKLLEAHKDGDH